METPNGELPYVDTSHVYHGQVLGEPNSHVFGSIHDGVFEGNETRFTYALKIVKIFQ